MKKDLKTEITKEKIRKAATAEFALYGFDGATVNQMCKKYDISKGLVYHNFESKEELYLRCLEEAVNEFVSFMSGREFGTDFKLYMKERYAFFQAHPNYSRLIFSVVLTDNTAFSEKIKAVKKRFDEFNKNVYLNVIDHIRLRKGISKEDVLECYSLLQNVLNGYLIGGNASENSFDSAFSNHEKSLEKILDFILYGIAEQEDKQ